MASEVAQRTTSAIRGPLHLASRIMANAVRPLHHPVAVALAPMVERSATTNPGVQVEHVTVEHRTTWI